MSATLHYVLYKRADINLRKKQIGYLFYIGFLSLNSLIERLMKAFVTKKKVKMQGQQY